MIQATVFETVAELQIHAKNNDEFNQDLQNIKNTFDVHDRSFDDGRRVWVIKNFSAYRHVPYIQKAIDIRKDQPSLF